MDMEKCLKQLERRCGRLEKQNSFMMMVCVVLAIALGAVMLPLQGVNARQELKELRANRLVIEDLEGRARAVFSVTREGPAITMWNKRGLPAVGIVCTDGMGGAVSLYDRDGNRGIELTRERMESALTFYDESGRAVTGMKHGRHGSSLFLANATGEVRFVRP